ncbi:MAG: secD [Verrucomicrobiaceae bacterium]|nr:secD [Verrucomicrobiaceae bacterium]
MNPLATFLSGSALLILFVYYLGTVAQSRKRWAGTLLSLLVSVFFLVTYAKMGLKKGIDLQGGSTFVIQLKPGTNDDGSVKQVGKDSVDQAISILEKRLNPDGSKDMLVQPTGPDRIEIQMPGVKVEEIEGVRKTIQQVAKLEFRLVHPQSGGLESKIGYVKLPVKEDGKDSEKELLVKNRADLDGKYVKQAYAMPDPNKGWMIILKFNTEGAKLFGELTSAHKGERLAVVVDNVVISAPNLNDAIFGGSAEISGKFTETSARALASALENPLENPMVILQEGTVSAAFGEATIRQGMLAGLVGLALTAIFLAIYYRVAGMIALAGLAVSLISVVGCMALFQFTLTMPGIAGLVLTIAMAVDANVLIYERLREEMREGKTLMAALDAAHDRAFTAIFDAHVTTLLTSLILLELASGMLKGFAITMIIGVFSTLLGALIVTRVSLHWFVDPGIITKLSVAEIIPHRVYQVMKYGKQFVLWSTALCVIAIAGILLKGEHSLGIDYRGGAKISFKLAPGKTLTEQEVVTAVNGMKVKHEGKDEPIGHVYVQNSHTAGGVDMITVRTEEFAGAAVQTKIEHDFKDRLAGTNLDTVGALIGKELAGRSAWAVGLALIGIFGYLYMRYEFSFALGALVSIFHDCIIVLGFSVIFGQELSLVHIGAVLTVVGYSVNDTIIVFDRVREIIRSRQGTITELMNEAISMTFSRTLLTSLVTFIPMMVLYLFGGPAMREFSLPIVIGVLVGTYSSVFVASPIVLWHARRTGVSLHKQLRSEPDEAALAAP